MFKFVIAAAALTVSMSAQAEMKLPGTVVATQCASEVSSSEGVVGVCFAKKTGQEGQFLEISFNNRTAPLVFEIVSIEPGNSGINGSTKTVQVNVITEGDIIATVYGLGSVYDIDSLYGTLAGYDFRASGFRHVYTTLSF